MSKTLPTLLAMLTSVITSLAACGALAQDAHAPAADHGKAAVEPAADHGKAAVEPAAHGDTPTGHAAPHGASPGNAHAHDDDHDAGPVAPSDRKAVWPGIVLILIVTMFALAAVIGPIARMHAPPVEMPPTHSHDEPPGASHHHGSSGTLNPEPGHGHGHASDHGHH